MFYQVSDLKSSISKALSGLVIDQQYDIDGTIQKAVRTMLGVVDVPEASDTENITLYDRVYDYEIDENIYGESINDFRPQGSSRTSWDKPVRNSGEVFDRTKKNMIGGYSLAFKYVEGVPILRVSSQKPMNGVILDNMNVTDDWTAAGSASGLAVDNTDFYDNQASLRFTLTGSSTGTLTKAIDSEDLTDYEDVGVAFLAVKIPTAASITSIELRLGSDSTNYNNVTATTGYLFAFKDALWMLVKFDFSTASQTGTPDWSAIDYAQLRIIHTATEVNFRVGNLFISLPSPHEFDYDTAAIFENTSGVRSKSIDGDSDSILLLDPAYSLLEGEAALQVARDAGGTDASNVIQSLKGKLYGAGNDPGDYKRYQSSTPSQRLKQKGSYGSVNRLKRAFNR